MSVRTRSTVMPSAANQAAARLPEAGGGGALLVGQDLAVGQPGVVVDGGVDVGVAQVGTPVDLAGVQGRGVPGCSLRRGSAVDAPAAAVGNVAELLDVDVDHVTWVGVLVADHGITTHRQTGGAVDPGELGQPQADDHPPHRRGVHVEPASNLYRSQRSAGAQVLDLGFQASVGAAW